MKRRSAVIFGVLAAVCAAAALAMVSDRGGVGGERALLHYLSLQDNIQEGGYQILRYSGTGYLEAATAEIRFHYTQQGWDVEENCVIRENENWRSSVELFAHRGRETVFAAVSRSGVLVQVVMISSTDTPHYPAGLSVESVSLSTFDNNTGATERCYARGMGAPPYSSRHACARGATLTETIFNKEDNLVYFYQQGVWRSGLYDRNKALIDTQQLFMSLDAMRIEWDGYSRPFYQGGRWVLVHSVNEGLPDDLFRPPSGANIA